MNQQNNQNRKPHNGGQRQYRAGDMLPSEIRLRDFVAKAQLKAMKTASDKLAALASHSAADTGRKNRDWKYNTGSSDLNVIPDSLILEGRARQMVRDSWIAKSIVKSYKRNIAGRGIIVTPHAKLPNGKPFTELNLKYQHEFGWWSRTKDACDVERKQTLGQMQRLAVSERATVGEHFWVWTYSPNYIGTRIDKSKPCGLRIQRFEPEQLDYRILSFQGNEVRGGIELDENGAAVAYHFFTRNPNDYLFRRAFWSVRIPRERVYHYGEQERVLQTRCTSPMTPVLQDMRDYSRHREAKLWRRIMEACIGVIFKKPFPTPSGSPLTLPFQAADPTGQTPSGMRTADFVPGMALEALPGEDVVSFSPQPTTGDDIFTTETVSGIGAGVGISSSQITRKSGGSYSSARQDMLEDQKEWEPEQDLLVDDLLRPLYELFCILSAMEGRYDDVSGFEMSDFLADRVRFVDAEYIPPPQTWIDPEKEANAFKVLLENRLITREEIIAMRGQRFYSVIQKIASEQELAETELDLALPENNAERQDLRAVIKALITQAETAPSTAQWIDQVKSLDKTGVPTAKTPQPLLAPTPPPTPEPPSIASPEPKTVKLAKMTAPNYRQSDNPVEKCASCSCILGTHCTRYDFEVAPDYVCDSWIASPVNQGAPGGKGFPPGPQPGQPPLERDFFPAASPSAQT